MVILLRYYSVLLCKLKILWLICFLNNISICLSFLSLYLWSIGTEKPVISLLVENFVYKCFFLPFFGSLLGKTIIPKGVNEVKLISSGKILENNKTVGQCKMPFGDREIAGGVIIMHVVVQPSLAKTKTGIFYLYPIKDLLELICLCNS